MPSMPNGDLQWFMDQFSSPTDEADNVLGQLDKAAAKAGVNINPFFSPNAQAAQIRQGRAQQAPQEMAQAGMPGMPFFRHVGGFPAVGFQHSPSLESLMNSMQNGYQQMAQMGFLPFGNLMGFNP